MPVLLPRRAVAPHRRRAGEWSRIFCDAPTQVSHRTVTMPGPRGLVRPTISRGSFTLALDGLRLASRRGLEGAIQAHWLPLLLRRDVHLAVRHQIGRASCRERV